ncbi:Hsp70 family protein [Paenibacillus kobensis]|uniref:molecular chaperone n=1 Tax=Paenibacillus kobensis TaxID=59841 RepID=UPI000FD9A617|nr:molecular chaperone [Paenibacillus kobensis]
MDRDGRGYSYKLYKSATERTEAAYGAARYSRSQLEEMTTYQLRGICTREKLIDGIVHSLDREELIRTVLKFRNAEESLLIREKAEGGFERVAAALRSYLSTPVRTLEAIRVPAVITLYEGMRTDSRDGYGIEAPTDAPFAESNVLLVDGNGELCGILNAVKEGSRPGQFVLYADPEAEIKRTSNRSHSLLFFRKRDSDYLYRTYYERYPQPPVHLHYGKIPVTELDIRKLEETNAVLTIDFGTSNTAAGAYLDAAYVAAPDRRGISAGTIRPGGVNCVMFPNAEGEEQPWIEMSPTVAAVADCSDSSEVRYAFGQEALALAKRAGYAGHTTVFRNMKRWVNGYDKLEEVTDPQGNAATVNRREVLRAYLLDVIRTAEHQFKCRFRHLHMTSPVKLKRQFLDMFADLLPEYRIETKHALDEGTAVLYNTIANQLERGGLEDGADYEALVIDCGGGTTDVSSCVFRVEDNAVAYKIDIRTSYENGDTNFGGSNLTYRILQYMKIVFAEHYMRGNRRERTDIDALIDIPATDLFRHVDDHGVADVYSELERRYAEAEAILPTRYKEYETSMRDDYRRVRGNYHFLWELAERLKTEFFRRTAMLRGSFATDEESGLIDGEMRIAAADRWFLAVRDQERLVDREDCPKAVFTIREMTQLVRADIYDVVRRFLDELYQDGRLQRYSVIKLTGQSCRIDVFREALKEFVPGKSIEFRQKAEEASRAPELKLACLRGAIRYLTACQAGFIEANVTNEAAAVPYAITAFTHNGRERTLMSSLERTGGTHGTISRPIGATDVEFHVKGIDGAQRLTYVYGNRAESYKPVLYEDIAAAYGAVIPQDETDSIANGEAKFFVSAGNSRWGFEVVPVARLGGQLQLGKKRFFAFEKDASELDFFDGMK